jgi:hypothetical protein
MEFHVLGRLEAERDGASVSLVSYKQRSLLALLLIHANKVLSTDRIIDDLWGGEVGADRQNALWSMCRTCAPRWSPIGRSDRYADVNLEANPARHRLGDRPF